MRVEELKCDANFMTIPVGVYDYVSAHKFNQTQYVGWWSNCGNVLRIFAYKWKKMEKLVIREVIRSTPDMDSGLVYRDMYLTGMCGWRVMYERKAAKSQNWYGYVYYDVSEEDFGHWEWYPKIGITYPVINPETLKDGDFEYCGWEPSCGDLVEYLRMWKENPTVEYFGKMGLKPTKSLLTKAKKDKQFVRFLWEHKETDWRYYGPQDIVYAYEKYVTLEEARDFLYEKHQAEHFCRQFYAIRDLKIDRLKIYHYCKENGIERSYGDYLTALVGLGYDLNDTKNLFPKNFRRMHDLRINEWDAEKAKKEKKAREKFNRDFRKASKRYQEYELKDGAYCILIPGSVKDLVAEGEKLDHCVGKMGYDAKMVNGVSFIAFLRCNNNPGRPYVTIEFGMKEKRILQIYGKHDSKPKQEVIDWAKDWERMVKDRMKERVV